MKLSMYKAKEPPRHALEAVGAVIAIAAGKGGVGKSTVAVNLALALRQRGYSVGILDADLYGPSIRHMLPEESPPEQKGELFIPALCFGGIRMISMAHFRPTGKATAIRAPIANGIIAQFLQQVAWGALDFLLIDFPPGTGDIQLSLAQKAAIRAAVMVTTPQEVALLDVRKAIDLFDQVRVPIAGIVENMSYYLAPSGEKNFPFGMGGGQRIAEQCAVPLLGQIPLDPEISRTGDSGQPLIHGNSLELHSVKQFCSIANALIARLAELPVAQPEAVTLRWKEMVSNEPAAVHD
jgi:ATP-binding protein involved in chromosome partitioning